MWSALPTTLAVLGLSLVSTASGVTQDWHLPLVGTPSLDSPGALPPVNRFYSVATQTESRRRSLALTLTDKHVLAALDPASGAIVWRRQYTAEGRPKAFYSCGESASFFVDWIAEELC